MNYPRIAQRFYGSEWMVRPDWHAAAGGILRPYLMGMAQLPAFAEARTRPDGTVPGAEISEGFALVTVSGLIGRHLDMMEILCGGGFDLLWLERQIQLLEARADLHTVIFRFNTPGGQAAGVPEAASQILELGSSKRTVAWCDNQACSAGYFLAAACGEIYAQPSADVGSISTILALVDRSREWEMEGLRMEIFTDGNLKSMGYPGTVLSDEQRAFLEARRDAVGSGFKSFVASRRPGVPASAMEGGWYSGQAALDLGLVDGFHRDLASLAAALV